MTVKVRQLKSAAVGLQQGTFWHAFLVDYFWWSPRGKTIRMEAEGPWLTWVDITWLFWVKAH